MSRRLARVGQALVPASLALASCVVFTGHANASGFAGIRFGYELGSVVAPNPTAIAYNPGALGFSGTQLFLDVTIGMRQFSWTHQPAPTDSPVPPGFEGANAGTATSTLFAVGPQFAASVNLGKLTLGGGWFVPWGGGTVAFDRNEAFASSMYPGAADGVARWHAYKVYSRFLFASFGAALRLGPISFGATGNVIISNYEISRALSAAGGNDLKTEQRVFIQADALHASFSVGAMLEALPNRLWLGASYQAQPGLGAMELDGTYTLRTSDGSESTRDITMHQGLPDVVRAGVRFRPVPQLELRLTADFTRWSLSRTQCLGLRGLPCTVRQDGSAATGSGVVKNLPRYWQNTLSVRAGASYWFVPTVELFGGLGFEPAAIPDATLDPVAADADNMTIALGGRVEVVETWFLAVSYNHQQFFPRDTTGRSQLTVPAASSRGVDGGGEYRQWFGLGSINLTKTF